MMTLTGFGGHCKCPPNPLLFRYYPGGPIRAGNRHVKLEKENKSALTHHVSEDFSLVKSRELRYTGIDSMQLMLGYCFFQPSGYGGLVIVIIEVV